MRLNKINRKVIVCVTIDENIVKPLNKYVKKIGMGCSRSGVVEKAIKEYIEKEGC